MKLPEEFIPQETVEEYIRKMLVEHFNYYLMYGKEAYLEKYGTPDPT